MENKTVQDIIDEYKARTGLSMSIPLACLLINKGMNELALLYETSCIEVVVPFKGVAENEEKPISSIGISRVTKDKQIYHDWYTSRGYITFKDSGDYEVTILDPPEPVTKGEDELTIDPAFHDAVYFYLVNSHASQVDPQAEQKFYGLSSQADKRLKNLKRRHFKMPARMWR